MNQVYMSFIYIIPPLILVVALAIFVIRLIKPISNYLNERAKQSPQVIPPNIINVSGGPSSSEQKINNIQMEDEKAIKEKEEKQFEELQKRFIVPKLDKKIKKNFDNLGESRVVKEKTKKRSKK